MWGCSLRLTFYDRGGDEHLSVGPPVGQLASLRVKDREVVVDKKLKG